MHEQPYHWGNFQFFTLAIILEPKNKFTHSSGIGKSEKFFTVLDTSFAFVDDDCSLPS